MQFLITVFFCAIGFVGSFAAVPISFPPHRVVFYWSLLFPLLATLVYGRRAAVFAACTTALFPLFLFPRLGWLSFLTAFTYMLWFFLHGWASDARRSGRDSLLTDVYAVQIFQSALSALVVLVLFPLFVRFNPPFWYPEAISYLPPGLSGGQLLRGFFNSFTLVIAADSLLRLPAVRRLFGLPVLRSLRMNAGILSSAFFIGLGFWILFAFFEANLRGLGFLSVFSFREPHDLLALIIFLGGGLFSGNLICRFSERRLAMEFALLENESKLEKALADKDVLFKELQHRVKNNLAMIESLLSLQSMRSEDSTIRGALLDAKSRIGSLTLIYDHLYRSHGLRTVNLKVYLDDLVTAIKAVYSHLPAIKIETSFDDVRTDLKSAVPLGFILNELLTNAIKHAFPDGRSGTIRVALSRKGDSVEFSVGDDGVGIPEAYKAGRQGSLGIVLVEALADQLKAVMTVETSGGTRVLLRIDPAGLERKEDPETADAA